MPRSARFKIAAISELLQQLRYAPEKTRQRQMDAAEQLVNEIDPARNYPQDFVVFRITGYRPEHGSGTMLVGEALLPDLVNFVLHISRDLHLPPQRDGGEARRLDDIAREVNVSTKTVQRYRAEGLVCHYVHFPDGHQRVACYDDAMRRFIDENTARVQRARGFTRITNELHQAIIAQARQLHESEHLSLNEAAARIAAEHGRAHETVRMILRKHDRRAADAIFSAPGPVTDREARLLYRAWRRNVPVPLMAERFGKTTTTIHRLINRYRATLLQALDLSHIVLPTFSLDDAASVILSHPAVTAGLDDLLPCDDALDMIAAAREAEAPDDDAEQAMIAAYNFLKHRAASAIAGFGQWPGAHELDAAETDLRWAHRLKRRLVSLALPAALRSIEQHLHRALPDHPAEVIVQHLQLAINVLANVIDTIDPSRGQRLMRLAGQAVDRALAAANMPRGAGRAAIRHRDGAVPLGTPFAALTPWAWLDPPPVAPNQLNRLSDNHRRLIILRHGLRGTPPMTCQVIADRLGRTPGAVARRLATAERELRMSPARARTPPNLP